MKRYDRCLAKYVLIYEIMRKHSNYNDTYINLVPLEYQSTRPL